MERVYRAPMITEPLIPPMPQPPVSPLDAFARQQAADHSATVQKSPDGHGQETNPKRVAKLENPNYAGGRKMRKIIGVPVPAEILPQLEQISQELYSLHELNSPLPSSLMRYAVRFFIFNYQSWIRPMLLDITKAETTTRPVQQPYDPNRVLDSLQNEHDEIKFTGGGFSYRASSQPTMTQQSLK